MTANQQFFGLLITQILGFAAVWVKARSAERLSAPTGNGFAEVVKEALKRIEGKIDRHVEWHATKEKNERVSD